MKKISGPIVLLKEALTIFFRKENIIFLVKINLFILPFSIFSLFQDSLVNQNTDLSKPINIFLSALVTIVNLGYVLTYVWVMASSLEGVRRVVAGEVLDLASTLKVGWKKYWKFTLLGLTLFFIDLFGFILLIVPGIIFVTWFIFSKFVIIEKEVGLKEALTTSKSLVSGRFFAIFGRILFFGLFSVIVQAIVTLIPYIGVHLLTLIGPMFILPTYLLYRELSTV